MAGLNGFHHVTLPVSDLARTRDWYERVLGFVVRLDVLSLRVPDRDGVKEWRTRLDRLGERHGAMMTGHRGGTVLVGLHDPDGVEIRLYAD
jgi:hypothetical protein